MIDEGVDGAGPDDCALTSTSLVFTLLLLVILLKLLREEMCCLLIVLYSISWLAAQPASSSLTSLISAVKF